MFYSFHERKTLLLIRNLIVSNQQHPIRSKALARQFGISTKKLRYGFKWYFDCSVQEFYLTHSMIYAKELLEDGTTIKEVAFILAYSKTTNFRRAYKRYYGHYPVFSLK